MTASPAGSLGSLVQDVRRRAVRRHPRGAHGDRGARRGCRAPRPRRDPATARHAEHFRRRVPAHRPGESRAGARSGRGCCSATCATCRCSRSASPPRCAERQRWARSSRPTSHAAGSQAWRAVTDGLGGARGVALFAQLERWRDDPPFSDKADRPAARALPPHQEGRQAGASATRARARRCGRRRCRARASCCTTPARRPSATATRSNSRSRSWVRTRNGRSRERQALQDALGAHQDAVVALAFLRAIDVSAQRRRDHPCSWRTLIERTRDSADDVAGCAARRGAHRG